MVNLRLIKPITIRNLTLASNLVQGPLAGYSCSAFRQVVWQQSTPGFCTTEMLSAKDLITRRPQRQRYVGRAANEKVLCFQLAGHEPEVLSEVVKIVEHEHGADLIDLNCGCPMQKIRKKGYGSKLLEQHQQLAEVIAAMRSATELPISIKIRVDGNTKDNNHLAVAKIAEQQGADFISVHGRHHKDDYQVPIFYHQVAEIVDAITIPVFANGDVNNRQSLQQTFSQTGCAGVMISRAGLGRPWLFAELTASADYQAPNKAEIGQLLLQHVANLIELDGERSALLQARSFAKYYARAAGVADEFSLAAKSMDLQSGLRSLVNDFFFA